MADKRFGSEPCCSGCTEARQLGCEMCGQCDELDPFAYLDDGSESSGDPFETFGDGE